MRKSTRVREDRSDEGVDFERVSEVSPTRADGADTQSADVVDYGELGEHVASVLEAAETAAVEIRRQAEQEAAAQVGEAGRQAGMILHETEGLRAEAEKTNRLMREEAEAYAGRTRRDADIEAAKVLQAADQAAATRASEEEARQRALREDIERTETRLTELGAGLRDLATRLEELVSVDRVDGVAPTRDGEDASLDRSLMASIEAERETDATP
jgi:hypothetical protein